MANLFLGASGLYGSTTAIDLLFGFGGLNFEGAATIQRQPTRFYAAEGEYSVEYTGIGLVYGGPHNAPVGGTITGMAYLQNGVALISLSNVAYDVAALNAAPTMEARHEILFAGNDLIEARNNADDENAIAAGPGNDSVTAGPGADTVFGNQGSDYLFGNAGKDLLYGGQGDDFIAGGQDEDLVVGNLGSDVLYGNLGADTIFGGQGDDTIYGGQGDDLIFGGAGSDVLYGNLGADRFVFNPNDGADRIFGFNQAEGDRLDLLGQNYQVAQGANGAIVSYTGGTIELIGIAAGAVNAGFFA